MVSYIKTEHPKYGEVARKECPDPDCGCGFAYVKRHYVKNIPLHFECAKCGTKFQD